MDEQKRLLSNSTGHARELFILINNHFSDLAKDFNILSFEIGNEDFGNAVLNTYKFVVEEENGLLTVMYVISDIDGCGPATPRNCKCSVYFLQGKGDAGDFEFHKDLLHYYVDENGNVFLHNKKII